jgi:DNA polymerase-3 subunit beta
MQDTIRKMHLHLSVSDLKTALKRVKRAVGSRDWTVFGTQLLLTTQHGSGLALAADNGAYSIIHWLDVTPKGETLGQLLDATTFTDLVKTLPTDNFVTLLVHEEQSVQTDAEGQTQALKRLWTEIESGDIHAELNGNDPADFPKLPQTPEIGLQLHVGNLSAALQRVIFAASAEDYSHEILTGIKAEFSANTLTLAAADGFRLAREVVTLATETVVDPFSVVIPAAALKELLHILKAQPQDTALLFATNDPPHPTQAQFLCGDVLLTTQLLDVDRYPDYQRIIPDLATYPTTVTLRRTALLKACQRAQIFSPHLVYLNINPASSNSAKGELTVKAEGPDAGHGETVLDAEIDVRGTAVRQMAFNPRFLIQLLQHLSAAQVTLAFQKTARPGVFYPAVGATPWEDYVHVIMPLAG